MAVGTENTVAYQSSIIACCAHGLWCALCTDRCFVSAEFAVSKDDTGQAGAGMQFRFID